MRLSRFVVVYERVRDDEHVLYDVVADQYLGVNDLVLAFLRRVDAGGAPADADEAEVAQTLAEHHFLVQDRAADDARLQQHLAQVAGGTPGTTYVTLLPTLACNLACTYCFQKDAPSTRGMTKQDEDATLGFVLRKVDERASSKLVVHYFGGEPLTRKDYLLRTAAAFSAAMASRGGTFAWEMTTNGVGLHRAFVEDMNRFGEGAIKITLDGDRETHDRARVHRGGKGTFDEIFRNLVEVAGSVRLLVGGNFYPGQEASYERLIDRLDEAGVTPKLQALKFKPVLDVEPRGTTCTTCSEDAKLEAEMLLHVDRLVRRKSRAPGQSGTLEMLRGPCELHWDNSFVIDPEGRVYRCPAVAGRPEVASGSVASGALGREPLLEQRPWETHAPCHDCAYLPTCMGGCLGAQYLRTGRKDQVLCKKEWLEASLREVIPRRYLDELGAAPWDGDEAVAENAPPQVALNERSRT